MTTLARRRQLAAACAVALIAALIALATLTPLGADSAPDRSGGDTCALGLPCPLGHLGSFALLGAALACWEACRIARTRATVRPTRAALVALAAALALAAADEAAQTWVDRDPQLADWLLDGVGLTAGYAAAAALLRRLRAALAARVPYASSAYTRKP
ncbi:MAG: hypothetical protein EXR63_05845 [Dehalococcoidia bacterium]|nr:hypothetical protein [Dehalococcoidia bacterium]